MSDRTMIYLLPMRSGSGSHINGEYYVVNSVIRAYVTPSNPTILAFAESKRAFEMRTKICIDGQVSQYKYIRGGLVAANDVPKREIFEEGSSRMREDRTGAESERKHGKAINYSMSS
ncbi:hypothetical protein K443DRAFT_206856 [Laccaria amethystina LaAM-08-1]|uniref:Uncharacterized protein n=1 Tax=Laccaria amethystina LaAM-08-1 TaxID=1095629 RepID=A0A0C9XLX4_9AGAR|nr:hypothetical protein K443DRAFT_206856 [Laccaria amethystina LaAM-08-1]